MGEDTGAGGELASIVTSTSALEAVLRSGNNLKLGLEEDSDGLEEDSAMAAEEEEVEAEAEAARGVTGFEEEPSPKPRPPRSSGPRGGEKSALTSLSVLLLMLSRCIEGR
jgi:hypothetical protein